MTRRRLAFVAVFHTLIIGETTLLGDDVNQLLQRAMSHVRLIDSLEMSWSIASEKDTLLIAGAKYRADNGAGDIRAFDGEATQCFVPRYSILTLNGPQNLNPYGVIVPAIIPYLWLLPKNAPVTWQNIKKLEYFEATTTVAQVVATKELVPFGVCDEIELTAYHGDSRIELYLSRMLNGFPVLWRRLRLVDKVETIRVEVRDAISLASDGNAITFPVRVALIQSGAGGNLAMNREYFVDTKTLKINHPIDDDRFHLPRSLARTVRDVRQMEAETAEELAKWREVKTGQPNVARTSNHVYVWALGGLALCAVVGWVWLRRRHRRVAGARTEN